MYSCEPSDLLIENSEYVETGIWGLEDLSFKT